jgi:Tfp pilus assembly protein PilX
MMRQMRHLSEDVVRHELEESLAQEQAYARSLGKYANQLIAAGNVLSRKLIVADVSLQQAAEKECRLREQLDVQRRHFEAKLATEKSLAAEAMSEIRGKSQRLLAALDEELLARSTELTDCRSGLARAIELREQAEHDLVAVRLEAKKAVDQQMEAVYRQRTLSSLLSMESNEEKVRLTRAEAALVERDLRIEDLEQKLKALRVECALTQEILIDEKSQERVISKALLTEWERDGSPLPEMMERGWIDAWHHSSELPCVLAEGVLAGIESPAVTKRSSRSRPPVRPEGLGKSGPNS